MKLHFVYLFGKGNYQNFSGNYRELSLNSHPYTRAYASTPRREPKAGSSTEGFYHAARLFTC